MAIFQRKQGYYDLYYEVREGKGEHPETIVFIHGLGFDSTIWQPLIEKLDPRFRVIVYDICGHGRSGMYHNKFTWPFFRKELFALLDHLNIKSCHLVGHGLGGIIATKSVVREDQCIKTLTLISTPFYFPEDFFKYEYDWRLDLLTKKRTTFAHEMALNAVYQPTPKKMKVLENAFRMVDERLYNEIVQLVFATSDGFIDDLKNIVIPTLVMGGELDPVFPINYTAVYSTYIAKHRLRIIPNASNACFMDEPEYVAQSLNDFITVGDRLYFSKSHDYLMRKINNILEKGQLVEQEEATLHINVINSYSVQWRKQKIVGKWNQRFAKELLLYLTLKERVTREDLIDAFLPEQSVTKARNYLRVMLNHLKQILSDFPDPNLVNGLNIDRQYVYLDLPVYSDLKHYLKTLKSFEKLPMIRQYDTLLQLIRQYHQSFLSGFNAPWINALKERVELRLGHYLSEISEAYANAGDTESAMLLLMEGKSIEPYEGYCEERIEEIKQPYRPSGLFSPPIG